eukprot:2364898-Amphidinium_carterae.1
MRAIVLLRFDFVGVGRKGVFLSPKADPEAVTRPDGSVAECKMHWLYGEDARCRATRGKDNESCSVVGPWSSGRYFCY